MEMLNNAERMQTPHHSPPLPGFLAGSFVPVWNVSAANHGRQVGDGIPCDTRLVEVRELANQVARQEAAMGAP